HLLVVHGAKSRREHPVLCPIRDLQISPHPNGWPPNDSKLTRRGLALKRRCPSLKPGLSGNSRTEHSTSKIHPDLISLSFLVNYIPMESLFNHQSNPINSISIQVFSPVYGHPSGPCASCPVADSRFPEHYLSLLKFI